MNHRRHPSRVLLAVVIAAFPYLVPYAAPGQPRYTITDLGNIRPTDVNDRGQVSGSLINGTMRIPVRWENGALTMFPTLGPPGAEATGINRFGEMSGVALGPSRAVIFKNDTTIVPADTTDFVSSAYAINDAGWLAGRAMFCSGCPVHAALWTGGGVLDLGSFDPQRGSRANDLNNAGLVVGEGEAPPAFNENAFKTTGGGLVNLGTLGGTRSEAHGVNSLGHVAGMARDASGTNHAVIWNPTIRDIETPPFTSGTATAINDLGVVVGSARNASGSIRAFVWQDGVMSDLTALSDTNFTWVLERAVAISNTGMIAGTGLHNGQPRAFLLRPFDTDGDGLLDEWETRGIDIDGDGTVDYAIPDADPLHKDLYVEVDAMRLLAPQPGVLTMVVDAFADAPVANPDGVSGINLHIIGDGCDPCVDDDDIQGADWANPPWPQFDAVKTQYFGTFAERSTPGWLTSRAREAKVMAVRYCVFARRYGTEGSGGLAEGIPANDFFVSLADWGPVTPEDEAGTFMHELGHTLGLRHGGVDDITFKPNFKSVMSYTWQVPVREGDLTGVAGRARARHRNSWRLDYSRERLSDLDESNLSEPSGIGGDPSFWVPVGPPAGFATPQIVRMGGPVNWDRMGRATAVGVVADVDFLHPLSGMSPGDVMPAGGEDWPRLQYLPIAHPTWSDVRSPTPITEILSPGEDPLEEMTFGQFEQLSRLRFDCNGNGVFDDEEIENQTLVDENENGIPDECELATVDVPRDVARETAMGLRIRGNPGRASSVQVISFAVPRSGRVTVSVFDVTGARVAGLLDRRLDAGEHKVEWHGRDEAGRSVPPGIYLAEVVAGNQRVVGKLIRLR